MEQFYECSFCEVDLKQFPIIIFRIKNMDPDLKDVAVFNELRESIYKQVNEPTVAIIDGTKSKWINSTARIQIGKDQKVFSEQYFQFIQLSIMVAPNALVKMMIKGVNLVSKPLMQQKILTSFDEALQIAKAELERS